MPLTNTPTLATEAAANAAAGQEDAVYRKVAWRLVPFLMLCYVVAYLDRVNAAAAPTACASAAGT